MPILMPDTSEAEDLRPSQAGTYRARITKCDAQMSKGEGGKAKVMMAVPTFTFEAPALEDGKPRKINRRSFMVISGPGSFNFDQLLRSIGEQGLADEVKARPGQVPIDTDFIAGKEVQVILTTGMYQGNQQDQISGVLPV